MTLRRVACLLSLAAGLSLAGCATGVGGPYVGSSEAPSSFAPRSNMSNLPVRLLALHNFERERAGVPPLIWDPQLAAAAASYGPALASLPQLAHSPRQSRPGQGENLWMGTAGAYSPEAMVGSWAEERRLFRPGIFPNVATNGQWQDVAHYTQMIWRTTTRVGCALHRTSRWDYLICRYSPAGNVDRQPVP